MHTTKEIGAMLRDGAVILYPTDTLWALGCDATNSNAVQRILRIKNRTDDKGLIVLVPNTRMLREYVIYLPKTALTLLSSTTKPLTIIYPKGTTAFAAGVRAPDGSVAVRIPRHDYCHHLLCGLGRPLVSTSANTSGVPAPGFLSKVEPSIRSAVDIVIPDRYQGKPTREPSQILRLTDNGAQYVLR